MHKCIVCKREKCTKGLSFHRFPKDAKQLCLWLRNIGKENYTPTSNSLVCSNHFEPECLEQKFNLVRLKKGSVPTVFTEGSHASVVHKPLPDENITMKREPKATPIVHALIESHGSHIESPEMHVLKTNATCSKDETPHTESGQLVQHDHQYTHTPRSYRRKLHSMYKNLSELRNSNRILNQKVKRLQTTVSSLKQVIKTMTLYTNHLRINQATYK